MKKIEKLSLEQIENDYWSEPEYNSYLVTTCHKLRKKRLYEFEVEDLRIMLGQDIGTKYLLPIAIEKLKQNPFAAGDFYDGDLLCSVARLPSDSFPKEKKIRQYLINICSAALNSTNKTLPEDCILLLEKITNNLNA